MKTELGKKVDVAVDEARLSRGWEGIEARAFAPPPRRWQPLALSVGGGIALAAALLLVIFGRGAEPAALVAEGGAVRERFAAVAALGGDVRFDDGSRITVEPGTELESLTNSGTEHRVLLHRGRARFEVEPGGPRRWIVEAGHASVEVIGTVFTVERAGGDVIVEVERGRVMVRSERLPEGLRILGAAERVRVEGSGALSHGGADPGETADGEIEGAIEGAGEIEGERETLGGSIARSEAHGARGGTPEVSVDEARARSAAQLLAEADEARRAGHTARALELLAQASERTGESEAALASLTRARLLSTLHRDAEAAADLRRALDAALPPALEESARYRLVSALAASGDEGGAERAASDYLRRYPTGSFRDEVLDMAAP